MKTNLFQFLILLLNFFYIKSLNIPNNILSEEDDDNSSPSSTQKEFELTREEIESEENKEEIFSPYKFSSEIFAKGDYVFDTASFYSWRNNLKKTDIGEYEYKNKKNENLKGTLKFNDLNLDYIEINSKKYNDYFGAICIPKNIPDRIKEKINPDNDENIKYSYLDLINSELKNNEKYINYIQDSINTGKMIFGKKNDIFDEEKSHKEIKSCSCISPKDTEIENEFLNFWNCKIDSFLVNSIKMPSSYSTSINGDIYAIFAIEEEYIIAPKITGTEIINFYKDLIEDNYDTSCALEMFSNDIKIMQCKSFNFAELPDFNIILDGEIYLIALSFDLFKEKNDTHVYFKILLNQANTREYWYLGDPIIKNYNLLFDYTTPGKESITIVQSDKYESMIIILFFCISSFITLLFYIFLIILRLRKMNKETYEIKDKDKRRQSRKIKNIIKNQNDFEIPKENITVENMNKINLLTSDKIQERSDEDEESNNESNNSLYSNKVSKSFVKNEKDIKYQTKENNYKNEIEMVNIEGKSNSSEEEDESDLNADDEGGIQPFNHTKLKKQ